MSAGAEHYRRAEKLLEDAQLIEIRFGPAQEPQLIGLAQVHATLALAAAIGHYGCTEPAPTNPLTPGEKRS